MKHRKSLLIFLLIIIVIIIFLSSAHRNNFEAIESHYENSSASDDLLMAEVGNQLRAKSVEGAYNKKKLLSITQTAAGQQLEAYVYVDMDHDGQKELIGVYPDEDNVHQTWYCSSDGKVCCLIHQNNQSWNYCKIELLELENETHVVINALDLAGIWKNYSIIALEDKEISILISNEDGYVYKNEDGDIILDIEAYDGMHDPVFGMCGHTWKDTYLYFDGESYKEYGATKITEAEYLSYENAQAIKEAIENELREPDTTELEYIYFRRKNNVLHIQCNVYSDSDRITYGYYTVAITDNTLDEELGCYNLGSMETYFSSLEVTY